MNQADYAAVEARIVNWLGGQEDVLERFRTGAKLYEWMASRIYGVPAESISNPSKERDCGKQAVLGGGFGMGAGRFKQTCAKYGIDISDALAKQSIEAYRDAHPRVVKLWYACANAARDAVRCPGQTFKAGEKLFFRMAKIGGIAYLLLTLPSGRSLAYPYPEYDPSGGKFENGCVSYWGQLPESKKWGRIEMFGGAWVENATQATAADLMSYGARQAEKRGHDIFLLIHDEALASGRTNLKDFVSALETLPAWAEGLPLKAEGKTIPYYLK